MLYPLVLLAKMVIQKVESYFLRNTLKRVLFFTLIIIQKKEKPFKKIIKFVCLFFWPSLEQQIIIKGKAEKLSQKLSDGYFESRPTGSKLGAWASNQSTVVKSRDILENNLKKFEEKFKGKEITRPPHWGGFMVKPKAIEFWQGRPNRMHDRILYRLKEDFSWKIERLEP